MSEWSSYLTRGTGPAKKALIGGNWKCNGTTSKIEAMIETLNSSGQFPLESEVVIACPTIHLKECKKLFRKDVNVAAQDVGVNGMGAYTGELSAEMLIDTGINWTLVG